MTTQHTDASPRPTPSPGSGRVARGARAGTRQGARAVAGLRRRSELGILALRSSRVLQVAVLMIVGQLAFRTWTTSQSWFTMDDFAFLSRSMNEGVEPSVIFEAYAGHVMPGGMLLSWVSTLIEPYDFTSIVVMMLAMQLFADIGLLFLLVRWFGVRPGILPPLALYLFSVISFPTSVWWASAANQVPMQAVLFWALAAHVRHLQTERSRDAWIALLWIVGGLFFFEKTLLVLGAIAIVSMSYFATGGFLDRARTMWSRYRLAVVMYSVLGAVYLVEYASSALNFDPGDVGNGDLPNVLSNAVFHNYLPALVGGPWRWTGDDQGLLPDTGALEILVSATLVGLLVREIRRCRSNSMRAWWLPVFFLACNVLLVVAGRSSFVGPLIALEYRYQGELAAVTAVALACATMPIRGAVERVEVIGTSRFLDRPRLVAAAVAFACLTATIASVQYIDHWRSNMISKPYFDNLLGDVRNQRPQSMMDNQVPNDIMWGLSYPINLQSRLLKPYVDEGLVSFTDASVDVLQTTNADGNVVPATVPAVRRGLPGPRKGCGYVIGTSPRILRLDGPVGFGGWWVRIGYLAERATTGTFEIGDLTYEVPLPAGVHAVYLNGLDQSFETVKASIADAGVTVCTDDVTVGRPEPAKVSP